LPDRDEIRITDAPLTEGQTVWIDGHEWKVLESQEHHEGQEPVRFICGLADEAHWCRNGQSRVEARASSPSRRVLDYGVRRRLAD
jgi:hypothetical protein